MRQPIRIGELDQLKEVFNRGRKPSEAVIKHVAGIIRDVRSRGDEALRYYTAVFDGVKLDRIEMDGEDVEEAYRLVADETVEAIRLAAENIRRYHKEQMPRSWIKEVAPGLTVGLVWRPLRRVGVYVPGGRAAYPSTALMTVVPAKVAGVDEVYVVSPPGRNGKVDPLVLVAADIAGADKVFSVGGPQAVAALAYGTETVPRVDKVVGPGNIYVSAAKLLVSRDVAIDMLCGPSELVILADPEADPKLVALDMMAQAEHDPEAYCVLISLDEGLAYRVYDMIRMEAEGVARASLLNRGLILIAESVDEALRICEEIAPEHLHLHVRNPWEILSSIRSAGVVILGGWSPPAAGDYIVGCNHVLPTARQAVVRGPLTVYDFLKPISVYRLSREACDALRLAVRLAEAEGLRYHALSLEGRICGPRY